MRRTLLGRRRARSAACKARRRLLPDRREPMSGMSLTCTCARPAEAQKNFVALTILAVACVLACVTLRTPVTNTALRHSSWRIHVCGWATTMQIAHVGVIFTRSRPTLSPAYPVRPPRMSRIRIRRTHDDAKKSAKTRCAESPPQDLNSPASSATRGSDHRHHAQAARRSMASRRGRLMPYPQRENSVRSRVGGFYEKWGGVL